MLQGLFFDNDLLSEAANSDVLALKDQDFRMSYSNSWTSNTPVSCALHGFVRIIVSLQLFRIQD